MDPYQVEIGIASQNDKNINIAATSSLLLHKKGNKALV
jgi:hypothetical protein